MAAHRRRSGLFSGRLVLPQWAYQQPKVRPVRSGVHQWPPPQAARTRVRRRPRYRVSWRWLFATTAVVVAGAVALIAIVTVAQRNNTPVQSQRNSTGSTATTHAGVSTKAQQGTSSPATGAASGIPFGIFDGGPNPQGVAAFAQSTGTRPTYALDYLPRSAGWASLVAATQVKAWTNSPYHLILGVPILPGTGTLALGASGGYNSYFATLAQNLIGDGEANAILRLAWEFNGNWFTWSVQNKADAANFVQFWRQIVTTMRAVPGARFKFFWTPNCGGSFDYSAYTPDETYPGDAYVNYIGSDVYDNYWGTPFTPEATWNFKLSTQWGLDWLSSFAVVHNKPMGIAEWSTEYRSDGHGLGDDPSFISEMAAWLVANNAAFSVMFAEDTSSEYRNNILDGTFPNSLAQFRVDFG
jgi:hypothetical protein